MSKLTQNELKVLKALDESEYGDSLTDGVWMFSVRQYSKLHGKTLSGTVSSLTQKGYVDSAGGGDKLADDSGETDAYLSMTEEGVKAYVEAVGSQNVSKRYRL